jgi:hypothetical protein
MIERAGWSNSLYLEWFSQSNGRVVVELVEPELRVSVPSWAFTEEQKEQRQEVRERYTGFVHKIELPEIRGGQVGRTERPALRRLDELNQTLVQGMAKLADALHGLIEGSEHREPALLIALLKRSVSKYHKAIEILDRLPRKQVRVEIAQVWRAEILAIREEILNEMNRLRQTE